MRFFVLGLLINLGLWFGPPTSSDKDLIPDDEITLISFEDLSYPPAARNARVDGVVVVRLTIDKSGNVVDSSPITGSLGLLSPALENSKKWKFKPNAHNSVILVYEFTLGPGACHNRLDSSFRLIHKNLASISACDVVVQ